MADRAGLHHLAELIGGAGVLAGGDVEPALLAHLGQCREILGRPDRFFQKHRRRRLARMRKRDRLRAAERAVHVDHQRHARADRLARGKHRRRRGLVQLDRAIAALPRGAAFARDALRFADAQQARIAGNLRAPGAADQLMQRHALDPGGEVPQRDVEPGDRKHGDAVAAEQMQVALDLLHEGRDPVRLRHFLAARLWCDHLLDRGAGGARGDVGEGVAPTGEAAIGRDLDHDHVERGDCRGSLAEACGAGVIGNAKMMRADVGDQHGRLFLFLSVRARPTM